MRTIKKVPANGDIRTRMFFAWFPVTIVYDGQEETRWLEYITVVERFSTAGMDDEWIPISFGQSL